MTHNLDIITIISITIVGSLLTAFMILSHMQLSVKRNRAQNSKRIDEMKKIAVFCSVLMIVGTLIGHAYGHNDLARGVSGILMIAGSFIYLILVSRICDFCENI